MLDDLNEDEKIKAAKSLLIENSKAHYLFIKRWLELFDFESPVDNLIVHLTAKFVSSIGGGLSHEIEKAVKSGANEYTSGQAVEFAIKLMRTMANEIESHHLHGECGSCCGEKH